MYRKMSKLSLVYNPLSGGFHEAHLAIFVGALSQAGFQVTPIADARGDALLQTEADIVCIYGGDGTLRDTVAALGEDAGRIPLCIAPSGTINLVARELGYVHDPQAFVRKLVHAWEAGPDSWVEAPLFRLGNTPIVSCLSIGPDSRAVAHVSGPLKQRIGRLAYVAALMKQLPNWPREVISLRGELVTGEPFSVSAESVIVSSSAYFAGPFRLSPEANLRAASLELVTLAKSTRLSTLVLAGSAAAGLPLDRYGLAEIRTVRRIEFDRCVTPIQVDGDHIPDCAGSVGPAGLTLRYVV